MLATATNGCVTHKSVVESEQSVKWRIVLVCATILGLLACVDSQRACGNTVIQEVPSPTGNQKAIAFYHSCGVLSDEKVSVSVLPAGVTLNQREDGNVFMYTDTIASAGATDSITKLKPVRVEWIGGDSLVVHFDSRARGFRQHASAEGTHVRFIPYASQ